ncbi:hypothetical protein LCI18_000867 [Fusarium solani-melongenae]|uniref:Uncharacterized protein n=1 Tax=Fusarium solani subsp. cucurbitae TaxID=2747967 RepID=A0ACD3YLW9_FUSSC|nr:hypothetical protein LCI18_000867 [Fusarium solani-melongenae]
MCRQVTIPSRIGESNDGLWREVLLGSPWFDSPVFWDLLWKVAVDHNGKPRLDGNGEVIMKPRDPRSGVLEMRFFDRWWLTASRLPLRRFENGDAVLPITMAYYQAQNGTEGNQWFIPRFM